MKSLLIISESKIINDVWDLTDVVYEVLPGVMLSGKGEIKGGYIKASVFQNIFDIELTVTPQGTFDGIFSISWFGAHPKTKDNYRNIQKSINTCIDNEILELYVPPLGTYNYSKGLEISSSKDGVYSFCTLHFYGGHFFHGSKNVSYLNLTSSTDIALTIQVNKGTRINNLGFSGQWKSPKTEDAVYFNTSYEDYKDISGQNCGDAYYGIAIDPLPSGKSGSTAIEVSNVTVTGFTHLIAISQNEVTQNADLLLFENIQLGNGKTGLITNQAQEKFNVIRRIEAWGRLHTVMEIGIRGRKQAGAWFIDGGNIAGKVIRPFNIAQGGWYSTHVSNLFAESISTIGNLSTGNLPMTFYKCTFHLNKISTSKVVYTNNLAIKFSDCLFRYYGDPKVMPYLGQATFDNCTYSGPLNNSSPVSIKNSRLVTGKSAIGKVKTIKDADVEALGEQVKTMGLQLEEVKNNVITKKTVRPLPTPIK